MDRFVSAVSVVVWLGGCQPTPTTTPIPTPLEPLPRAIVRKHTPSTPIPLVPPQAAAPSPRLRDELDKIQSEVDSLHKQLKGDQ